MRKILIAVFLSTGFLLLKGQDKSEVPDPEFINHVFVMGKDHKLQNLEKKDAEMKTKSKVGGMGGAKQMYIIEGGKSEVVLAPDSVMFVIGTGGSGFASDPSRQFGLYKFDSKKNNRETTVATYGGMGNKGKSNDDNEVSVNYKKLKEGVYGIVPEKPLEKGEYAFINKMGTPSGRGMKMEAFAFSIQ